MKRLFSIHGWEGSPQTDWHQWVRQQMQPHGYQVTIPTMPNTKTPIIKDWVSHLSQVVGKPDTDTHFIAHSIGCQTVLRYLETLPENTRIGRVVLVAGFVRLVNLEGPESEAIVKPWMETPIDWAKIKPMTQNWTAIYSNDDPWVTIDQAKIFKQNLDSQNILIKDQEHFSDSSLPVKLTDLLPSSSD